MQKGLILLSNRAEHRVPLTVAVDNRNTTNNDLQNYNGDGVAHAWGGTSSLTDSPRFSLPLLRNIRVVKSGRTRWKVHVKCDSHCIMSKKMGMVALRSSISGTSVISSMGPTISGMNLIL